MAIATVTAQGVSAGLTKVPMVVMILCWCGLRMAWVSMTGQQFHDLRLVLLGYPVSWVASSLIIGIYLWKADWIHYYEKHIKQV